MNASIVFNVWLNSVLFRQYSEKLRANTITVSQTAVKHIFAILSSELYNKITVALYHHNKVSQRPKCLPLLCFGWFDFLKMYFKNNQILQ